jgi:hypothetical protein
MKIYISGKNAGIRTIRGNSPERLHNLSGCGEAAGGIRGEGEAEWLNT